MAAASGRDRIAVSVCLWGLRRMSPALRRRVEIALRPTLRFDELVKPGTHHGPTCVDCRNGITEFHRSRTDEPNRLREDGRA